MTPSPGSKATAPTIHCFTHSKTKLPRRSTRPHSPIRNVTMPIRVLLALLCLALSAMLARAADATRPNIIFVLVDDMGHADLGGMGAKDIRTPNIDRLASEGLKFTDFYANAPVCTPTRTAFITGRWQQRVGLEWAFGFTAEQYRRVDGKWIEEPDKLVLGLPTSEATIAQMLKAAGYATGAFGKWHLGYQPQYNPT